MFRPLLVLATSLAYVLATEAATLSPVGQHPTSGLTGFPAVHDLKQFRGRIYLTYGDWNWYPAVTLTSYDPDSNSFRIEFAANTDSVGYLREWNGKLYAPSVDPIHYEDFREYSVLDPAVGWRDRAPWGCYHVFDFAALPNEIFAAGAKDVFENTGTGLGILWRSTDGERTWTAVRSSSSSGRYYWCFPHLGRVYVQDGYWENGNFFQNNTLSAYANLYNPTPLLIDGAESIIALSNRTTGIADGPSSLVEFKNGVLRTLVASAYDFTWAEGRLWVLTGSGQVTHTDSLPSTPTWTTIPLTGIPSNPTCLEVYDGILYIGNLGGNLYAARLDEQPLSLPPLTVSNLVGDAFGKSMALEGGRLAVGAPDFSGTMPVSGRAQLFQQAIGNNPWTELATLDPPAPRFSGWFAKDVALLDDVMAVVEAGYDPTRVDRGSAARVHVYQNRDGAWQSVTILSVPFAHSVALLSDMLAVGTSNPAANQVAGRPGVNPYRITRDATGLIALTAQAQLAPLINNWGYKSTARVLLGDNLLIAGFSGDVSRDGAPGMVSVFSRNANGTGFIGGPTQELRPSDRSFEPDRFGFALSYDGTRLAVGAPRDDTAAKQAGAVHVYIRNGNTFTLERKILCPVVEAEANFGHAVAIRGNTLLVGCPGATVDGITQRGTVFVLKKGAGTAWIAAGQLHAPPAVQGEFGIEVAMDDAWMAAGSRFSDAAGTLTERIALASIFPGFATWAAANGLTGADVVSADPDGDGLSNLSEYAMLLDPRVADAGVAAGNGSWRGQPRVTLEGSGSDARLVVTFVRRVSDARLGTGIEVSTDLGSWQQASGLLVARAIQNGVETRTVSVPVPAGAARCFVRLRAEYTF